MSLEQSVHAEGKAIFALAKSEQESIFNKDFWIGRMMDWVMKDPSFKVDLFQFVDVLPALTTNDEIAKHLQEYLMKKGRSLPGLLNTALKAANISFAQGLAASTIKKNVTDMAARFIAGSSVLDALPELQKLNQQGLAFTVDLLGEKTLSDEEADSYLARVQSLIVELSRACKKFSNTENANNLPNVSIKISALSCRLQEEDISYSVADVKPRVLTLLRLAKEHGAFVNFDVESYETREIIFTLFREIALSDEFLKWPLLGIVVQAYLKHAKHYLSDLVKLCHTRRTPITVRLVKGAYWDYEVVKAKKFGYEIPVFETKGETDLNFESLSTVLLDNVSLLRPAFGSHNIRSLAHAIAYANSKKIPKNCYEIQMLYGMGQAERRALCQRGHTVRVYVPIGEMLPGMAYLVRRLLENTSQMGFLKLTHHDRRDEAALLAPPEIKSAPKSETKGFINAPHIDFTESSSRANFKDALKKVLKSFSVAIPIMINGQRVASQKSSTRMCPSDTSLVISKSDLANVEHASLAMQRSVSAFLLMATSPLIVRQQHLLNLADILTADRFYLAAVISLEVGKTWAEADADVAEAIDFCRYYALQADLELSPKKLQSPLGEQNVLKFQGRGPTIIIAPWNFPLAIISGMSVAAYVAGNPIIIKPSEQSMLTAFMLYERMMKAGFIKEAVQFLPGVGEEIGPYLVSHKDVANICFTGSKQVGHEIARVANTVSNGQRQMKRVICEMGGKNAIIVDDDADLDEAVSIIINSAFSYAGQKCSAASRVIAVKSIMGELEKRLVGAAKSVRIGAAHDPSVFMGPVVDEDAFLRLNQIIKKLSEDNIVEIAFLGEPISGGYFVPIMIVKVRDPFHWVMQEELFGPILVMFQANNLEHAVSVANSTEYALTGAFISRSPANIAYVRDHFMVGNLYINQKCTGAVVSRQPFGGFKMSGTGIKAGGPDYLINLVDTRVISENTMRQGFTPEIF